MSTAKLNATGYRWVAELANYNFEIKYCVGKLNGDADALSRRPLNLEQLEEECSETVDMKQLDKVIAVKLNSDSITCVETVDVNLLELEGDLCRKLISREEMGEAQRNDPVIGPVFDLVVAKRKPSKEEWSKLSEVSKVMMHQFSRLEVQEGMLVRKMKSCTQIVLPEVYHKFVLCELHNKMGHLGAEKVEELSRQRFYWPYMGDEITKYIRTKCSCVASKQPPVPEKAPLVPIMASAPFEMVCIDFLHLDKSQGYEHILIVTDHFTRFSQAYATKNESSLTAARKLFNEFILQFGFPARIHHDRGEAFNSSLFKELHRLAGISMSNTTPHR